MSLTVEQEQYIEHEVKLRLHDERFTIQDKNIAELKTDMRELRTMVHSQFQWTLGIMVTLFGGFILTKFI